MTNLNAPRYKVVTIDISTDEPETRDFIPELKDGTLSLVKCVNKEYFVVVYKRNVSSFTGYLLLKFPNVDIYITHRSMMKYTSTQRRAFNSNVWRQTFLALHP